MQNSTILYKLIATILYLILSISCFAFFVIYKRNYNSITLYSAAIILASIGTYKRLKELKSIK